MKTTLILILAFFNLQAFAKDYSIDRDHSSIEFKVAHLTSKVSGAFTEFEGTFSYDEKKPEEFKLNAVIQAASIDTRNKKRDEHLRSPDFFNVQKFPTLTYAGKKVTKVGDKKFKVEGDLTMVGKTLPVTLDVETTGEVVDPWGNHKTGGTATGKLNRKDYGIVWNKALDKGGFVLGDEVEITLNLEVNEKKPEAPAPKDAKAGKKK